MGKVVTFGEIMLRLNPPGFLRFGQAGSFEVSFGGGEANVSASLANFGIETDFVTRLPKNDLGDACLAYLRRYGIGTSKILRGGSRIGIYFLENGAVQRGSKVIYDREGSSIATIQKGMLDWDAIFADADWFHWTGITPAVSESLCQVCLEGILKAREKGLTVSCDLNYRAKLWKWGKKAGEVMPELVRHCDVAVGNEEDADKVFGIRAPDTDVTAGKVEAEKYAAVAEQLKKAFPNLKRIAITLRGSLSASHNTWSGVLYDGVKLYLGQVFNITDIVDRVGGGDAFVGGLIYGFKTYGDDLQKALDFAVAASCLKHSVIGDFNMISTDDAVKIMSGEVSGRVSR
ncbi:MAG: sugar kinase [Deltaproteobacteria bacterium]|nr:sugar kinase [Deltaproteobacteria bacterium]